MCLEDFGGAVGAKTESAASVQMSVGLKRGDETATLVQLHMMIHLVQIELTEHSLRSVQPSDLRSLV